ncbi:MAG: chemotaxis response regulator protein-glutamate methylesterase [Gallionellaceae bacterium]|nr:chemotaxis response regulator protein-glutamate methylesterase [Gallionellaceae bacterium]
MRIAIVNDMKMAVEALRRTITSFPGYEVAWIAENGMDAIKSCAADVPDLILMDIIMPHMDGVEATRQIMANSPCAILVVTASVDQNAPLVFQAMGAGALDVVSTPILGNEEKGPGREELLKKIKTISRLLEANRRVHPFKGKLSTKARISENWLIAIGASTGGPAAIANIISKFPANLAASVVIIQHVDQSFAAGLAQWLGQQSVLPVKLAEEGDEIEQGRILVAGTNDHLVLKEDWTLGYKKEPVATPYRPSVDIFFESMVHNWPGHSIAVLLTGMGRDGAEGLLRLRNDGVFTLAQNAETCAVYGMPKAAAELNAAVGILPADDIAKVIMSHMGSIKKRNPS